MKLGEMSTLSALSSLYKHQISTFNLFFKLLLQLHKDLILKGLTSGTPSFPHPAPYCYLMIGSIKFFRNNINFSTTRYCWLSPWTVWGDIFLGSRKTKTSTDTHPLWPTVVMKGGYRVTHVFTRLRSFPLAPSGRTVLCRWGLVYSASTLISSLWLLTLAQRGFKCLAPAL